MENIRLDLTSAWTLTKKIIVNSFENKYLVSYAEEINANYILRGIRSVKDYEYEKNMRHINQDLNSNVQTIFLMPPYEVSEISSSMVRGLVGPSGWEKVVGRYVNPFTLQQLNSRYNEK